MNPMYYKIPAEFVARLGLTNVLTPFPDGRYLCSRNVLARIHRDPEKALEITGGIALTLDQARDEQMGRVTHPLPGDAVPEPEDLPLYSDDPEPDPEAAPEEGGAE